MKEKNDSRLPLSNELAASLVHQYWTCLPGFSSLVPTGVSGLTRVLQESTVSVDHARHVAKTFDERCPTPREIREHADRCREDYERKPNPIDEWKKQGATYDPAFTQEITASATNKSKSREYDELRWRGIRDALAAEASPMPFCRGGAPACQCGTCKDARNSRGFWAEFIFQMRRDHPDEVAAIRAGRDPQPQPSKRAPVVPIPYDRPAAPATVITAADIAAAPKLHTKRCEICEGTGRVTDGFCNQCQLGRELERVEKNSVAARLEPDYTGGRPGDSETG